MARLTIDDIFDDDLIGNVAPRQARTGDEDRIRQGFEDINQFIDRHGHKPGEGDQKASVAERSLQFKLKGMSDDPVVAESLAPYDRHGLLADKGVPVPTSLDDILDLDDNLLTTPADDIFTIRHVTAPSAKSDWVSTRKRCADFENFKPLLDACANDLKTGRRRAHPFRNEQSINPGDFYILNGVLVLVAEVNDPHIRGGKKNARLRLIFDNETEGENLLRSLATELYKDPNGRRISDPDAGPLFEKTVSVTDADRQTGLIYVVRSLSSDPEITKLDGQLFKIGVTKGTIEDRIRPAKDDPTFLMAPVHPVCTFTLMNADPVKVENLIHRFFSGARLDIELRDRFGKPINPREWFLIPLPQIERAIELLIDGSIVDYSYDVTLGKIIEK
jgi:hypothetical protein